MGGGESASLMCIQHVNMTMLLVRIQPTLAAVIIKKMFVDPSATAFIVFITVDHIFLLLSCRSCVLLPCTRWLCLCRPDNTACPGLPLLIFQRPKKSEEPIFGGLTTTVVRVSLVSPLSPW